MGMSFIGSYSGIDQNTINQLMEAERIPLKRLESKKVDINAKKDAWKDVNTRLNSLFEKMKLLKKASTFDPKSVKVSDEKYIEASVGNSATPGVYKIKVNNLASSSSIRGNKIDSGQASLGGDFSINALSKEELDKKVDEKVFSDFIKHREYKLDKEGKVLDKDDNIIAEDESILKDSEDFTAYETNKKEEVREFFTSKTTIDVKEGESLSSISKKINDKTKDTGVSSTVVDNRIVLSNSQTGKDNNISLSEGTKDLLSNIGLTAVSTADQEDGSSLNGVIITRGKDANFIINDIPITSSSNNVTGVIEGVTVNLNRAHIENDETSFDTITVDLDTEKIVKAVQDFIDQYHSTIDFIEEKIKAGDPKVPGSKGVLAGEGSLQRLQDSLRRLITNKQDIDGSSITDISKLGITTTDKSGKLTFDKEKFLEALNEDKESVVNFFSSEGITEEAENGEKITKKTGLVDIVNTYIDGFISKKDGIIKSQNESFEKTLKDLSTRIENFEARMVKKEAYYVKTFTALDLAMMKAEDQMGWLQGQVDAMNGIKR